MNNYEFMVIVNPDLSEEDNEKLLETLDKEITQNKGTVVKREDLGKKEMAYEIDSHAQGIYMLYDIAMESQHVKQFEKRLKMLQNILRYLLLKKDKKNMEVKDGGSE